MIIFRKRLMFWLAKAYIKRLGKRIFIFFILGFVVFFALLFSLKYFLPKIPVGEKETIGMVGAYTLNSLPDAVISDLSRGLTFIDNTGSVKPAAAKKWKIQDSGKTYVFYLKDNIKFTDSTDLISTNINYNFSDAKTIKPAKNVIVFKLKESFAPFLTTVSRPIFKKGFVGLGEYKIKDVDLNGDFVQSINLISVKNSYKIKKYNFYPTASALKNAFLLGEISKMIRLNDVKYKNFSFNDFPNTKIEKKVNYNQMITLFFNTKDSTLSDKKIRSGLIYSIQNEFPLGKKSGSPYSPSSWAYTDQYLRTQDLEHAKILLSPDNPSSKSASMTLRIKTFEKYKKTAEIISNNWKELGIKAKIELADNVPDNFQIFLGDFYIPKDPDQYMLWHSQHENNITKLENKRIDKYLEDGRKTTHVNDRKKIYADFQKYLLDESPAAFLYFPYEYEVTRK